jgi:hypothetical protein
MIEFLSKVNYTAAHLIAVAICFTASGFLFGVAYAYQRYIKRKTVAVKVVADENGHVQKVLIGMFTPEEAEVMKQITDLEIGSIDDDAAGAEHE